MRPASRFIAAVAIAAASSLHAQEPPIQANFVRNAITHTHQKPVLEKLTQLDVDAFRGTHNLDDIHLVSAPTGQTKEEKLFMKKLTEECHAMGLGFVPNVFVTTAKPTLKDGLPVEQIDLVSSSIDNDIGPYIVYRADVIAALDTPEEIAIADHELEHLARLIDYNKLHETGGFFGIQKSLSEQQNEELDADDAAIKRGHGKSLLSGLKKVRKLDENDFAGQVFVFGAPPGTTYESAEKEQAAESDHPLYVERCAIDLQKIQTHRLHMPRWMKLGG